LSKCLVFVICVLLLFFLCRLCNWPYGCCASILITKKCVIIIIIIIIIIVIDPPNYIIYPHEISYCGDTPVPLFHKLLVVSAIY